MSHSQERFPVKYNKSFDWSTTSVALSQQASRFWIPFDVKLFETLTPIEYLSKYCRVSNRRYTIYKRVFDKHKDYEATLNIEVLPDALSDVYMDTIDRRLIIEVIRILDLSSSSKLTFGQFRGIAAFSERYFFSLSRRSTNTNSPLHKDVLEKLDFSALEWKTTTTMIIVDHTEQSIYDDNKDIIWPTVVGIFVALALGWMICRYKCSSNDRSPHIVQCCPKSLCKRIRLCCLYIFSCCRLKNETQRRQYSIPDLRMTINRGRPSSNSVLEIPFILNNSTNTRSSIAQSPPTQWPPPFLLNNQQGPSLPLSITIQSPMNSSEPKRHPLRRESVLPDSEHSHDRRDSSPWPFQSINMVFHKQTNEIKKNHLFFNT